MALRRILSLPLLTFYGTGMILGAGIYTLIGKAAGLAGESVWLSLVIASVSAGLTALSYAELAAMFPKVGGEFVYLKAAFPRSPWIAQSGGILMIFADIAVASTVALAFSGYLQQFVSVSPSFAALMLLGAFTLINIAGIRQSTWMNVVFTLVEVMGLVLVIAVGSQAPNFGAALHAAPSLGTISGSALIIFAYFGFDDIVNFAEETQSPEKTIPRAILWSLAIATVLYILVALATVSLLPLQQLAQSEAPFADAVRSRSPRVANALAGLALFATANTVLISLLTTSRIILGMSRGGALPRVFAKVSKRKTPWVAALLTFAAAVAFLPLGKVEILASVSSLAALICFALVNIAHIALRFRLPNAPRPFRVPGTLGRLPVFSVLGTTVSVLLMTQFDPTTYVTVLGFVGGVLAVSLISTRSKRPRG